MREILIAGGGPAGAAAAIAGRQEGVPVRLVERARHSRHKVCGEFLSPGACQILDQLGAWTGFAALAPQPIRRCALHVGRYTRQWNLAERGWGLSRLALDRLLLERASALGAVVSRGESLPLRQFAPPAASLVVACGRQPMPPPGDRLFGFKAHFEGPSGDAVELFFDCHGYAGVSGIENGRTNVCGIAPESLLRRCGFDFDAVATRARPLADRLGPLRRCMPWIVTGPLAFVAPSPRQADAAAYPAGDALGFADPFTGTGIMNALLTGRLAGMAAARQLPAADYQKQMAALLASPFRVSSVLRQLVAWPALHWLVPCLPARALFRFTRAV